MITFEDLATGIAYCFVWIIIFGRCWIRDKLKKRRERNAKPSRYHGVIDRCS